MSKNQFRSATETYAQEETFAHRHAICPHCGRDALMFGRRMQGECESTSCVVDIGVCSLCFQPTIGMKLASKYGGGIQAIVWPRDKWPDHAPAELEASIKRSYDEARACLHVSPAAAATLARRCIQMLIRTKMGIKKARLVEEINAAAARPDLMQMTKEFLHDARLIGNAGAHPTIVHASEQAPDDADPAITLLQVDVDAARFTLQVVDMMFEDLYELPKRTAEIRAKFNPQPKPKT